MELMTSWERKGREEGLHEGTLLVALRLLRLRVGALSPELEARVRALSNSQLEHLCESTFHISSAADVEAWFNKQ